MADTKAQSGENQPDVAWLESQYNVRSYLPDHPKTFARWAEQSRYARFDLDGFWNQYFGESEAETVDVIPGKPGKPLLIFIHGGYWRSLDKYDFTFLAKPYVARGYSVALLNYGLIPRVTIEDSVRQTLRGIEWLYRQADRFGFDANQIVVCGHSAGGHLGVMSALAFWPLWASDLPQDVVKSVIAISGIYDLSPLVHTPFIQKDLKHGKPGLDAQAHHSRSPGIWHEGNRCVQGAKRLLGITLGPKPTLTGECRSFQYLRQHCRPQQRTVHADSKSVAVAFALKTTAKTERVIPPCSVNCFSGWCRITELYTPAWRQECPSQSPTPTPQVHLARATPMVKP